MCFLKLKKDFFANINLFSIIYPVKVEIYIHLYDL